EERVRRELQRQASGRASEPGMVPQPRRSEGADRTLAAVLQRAAAAQRPWLQTPGDSSPELVGTQYHSPRTHCLIGYKFHTQVRWQHRNESQSRSSESFRHTSIAAGSRRSPSLISTNSLRRLG